MAKAAKQKVDFTIHAPDAKSVAVAGDFTDWEQSPIALKRTKNGTWKKTVSLAAGRYEYRFLVDGQWQNDPACTCCVANPYGGQNCVREVALAPGSIPDSEP
ncbi:MAG: isoamylase early set domain-containing protein [Verrucomicrobiota bacterium]